MYSYDEQKTVLLTNIRLQDFGGSEINCLSIAKALKEKGFSVEVATLEAADPILSEFMKENILVKSILKEDLPRKHYDIIWAHHAVAADYVLFTKRITANKIVLSSLSPFEPYEGLPGYANEASICLANSEETKQKLIEEGIAPDKLHVFPNYVSAEWLEPWEDHVYNLSPKKIAIVSNHVPEELLLARDILMEKGCEVDIYGLGHKVTFIKPETLKPYDVVITIGKTVQYAMAMQIPVYCYDVHGGPGYLKSSEIARAAYYNFSGRGFPRKNAEIIANDVINQYKGNLEILSELLDFIRETAILENNIEDVLAVVDQADCVDMRGIQTRYAHRERSNQAVLRLLREKKNVEQQLLNVQREYDIVFDANAKCYTELQRNEKLVEEFQNKLVEMNQKYDRDFDTFKLRENELWERSEKYRLTSEDYCNQLNESNKNKEQLQQKVDTVSLELKNTETIVRRLRDNLSSVEQLHNQIIHSRGYRLLSAYYRIRVALIPNGSIRYKIVKAIVKPFLTVFRKIKGLRQKKSKLPEIPPMAQSVAGSVATQGNNFLNIDQAFEMMRDCKRIDIISVEHTAYIARLLQGILWEAGLECNLHLTEPETYENIPYIMICPQNFKRFPPMYIAYQMEQTINSRWLTDEYLNILQNAYAVFDYSLENIKYFSKDPSLAGKLYYVPVDVCNEMLKGYEPSEKEYDVLFYGAPFIDRRQEFLKPIAEKYNMRVICDKFGPALYEEMKKARLVINVHYYQNALLETTRLYETLSASDCLIVSERSNDPTEEVRLENMVDFTEIGNVEAMMERIGYWLAHEEERKAKVEKTMDTLRNRANATKFYLYRFLLANDNITFDQFYQDVGDYIQFEGDRVCLSLPESITRREAFINDNKYGFEFFPGLKHRAGWIGCGMSYKFMLRKAKEQQLDRILICEDDVYFSPDFEKRFQNVLAYIDERDDWSVFSGIMADLGRVKALKYENAYDEEFVYLDKMISMVFNIYDSSMFDLISSWDNMNRDVNANTVDRYLEDKQLRVLTTCPFLVGHKEDLNSTIWGAQNTIYTQLIEKSSQKLREIVDDLKKTL